MLLRFLSLLLLLCAQACSSPETLMLNGRYDAAIERYSRNHRKTERVIGLEKAFEAAQRADLTQIHSALHVDSGPDWVVVQAAYYRIKTRQNELASRMPIRSREGYAAQFDWQENIDSLELDAREHAADQLYNRALSHMEAARTGDQPAARSAFDLIDQVQKKYFPVYRESAALLEEARKLGTVYVLVDQAPGFSHLSPQFFQYLNLAWQLNDRNWSIYHYQPEPGLQYQYLATLSVEWLEVGFEDRLETIRTEEKDIEVRVEIAYDSSGQVISRTPVYEKIQASVRETRITRNSSAQLRFELRETGNGDVLYWETGHFQYRFDETWVDITGDQRALTFVPISTNIGLPCAPAEWTMLSKLADNARLQVLDWFWWASTRY